MRGGARFCGGWILQDTIKYTPRTVTNVYHCRGKGKQGYLHQNVKVPVIQDLVYEMVPVGVNAPTDPEDGTESEKTNTFIPTLKILYNFISCSNRWPESIRNLHPLNYVFNRFLQTITQKNILWYKTLLEFQNK